ncbi:MAG: type IV pilus assembly protein PilM [Acidobacteriota bacterium]
MFFGKSKNLLGLDIGSSAIKLVELKDLGRGKGYRLENFAVAPLPAEAVVGGTIMDSGSVIDAIQRVLRENGIKNTGAATSVDGNSVITKRISMTAMSDAELNEAIQWEAGQYIPFDVEEVKIDHQVLETDPATGNLNVLLVAAKRDLIAEYSSILTQAGLNPSAIDIDSFCIQNAYELNYPINANEVTALVNIGASTTNIAVVKGSTPLFWRDIQAGGNNYTDTLQREMSLTFEQAEAVKKGEPLEGVRQEQVVPVLNAVTEEFSGELKKTLDFFRVTTNETAIHRIILSGGGTRIPNLDRYLSQFFGIPVEIMNPFQNILVSEKDFSVDAVHGLAPRFAVAVGLALRKMGE